MSSYVAWQLCSATVIVYKRSYGDRVQSFEEGTRLDANQDEEALGRVCPIKLLAPATMPSLKESAGASTLERLSFPWNKAVGLANGRSSSTPHLHRLVQGSW
jgi:hypothetical protein